MVHSQPRRARRCQLSVPGSSDKMMAKAADLEVDQIILDLEDAVAPSAKEAAREQVIRALNTLEWQASTLSVRINDIHTHWCHDDVIDVVVQAGERLDTLILPKTNTPYDVRFVHTLLDQLDLKHNRDRRVGIEGLIEDVEGLKNVEHIATCSDRLETLIFGMGDYSASQHMQLSSIGAGDSYPPDIWHYPRYKLVIACRSAGIEPMDGPYANFRDEAGFNQEVERAFILGMSGKWVIHPSQIEPAVSVFTPSTEAVATARKQKAAYEDALQQGLGAINVDGVMVDAASIRIVQTLLDRAELIGL